MRNEMLGHFVGPVDGPCNQPKWENKLSGL